MGSSYYSESELKEVGLKDYGEGVKLSRKASIYSPGSIELGDNVRIDDFCILSGNIRIGSHVHLAPYCGMWGKFGIKIGDYVGVSSRVSIYSSSGDYVGDDLVNAVIPNEYRPGRETGTVTLEDYVVVGASSVILPGVTLNEGASVGAMSLVKSDLTDWYFYTGQPARKVKKRDEVEVKSLARNFAKEYAEN